MSDTDYPGAPMGSLAAQDSYDPFDAEKFVNPLLAPAMGSAAQLMQAPQPDTSPVRFATASPLVNITDQDIDRGINIGMAAGPGAIKAYPTPLGVNIVRKTPTSLDAYAGDKYAGSINLSEN